MVSSCQCQTSPGTEGTGTHGHDSSAGVSTIASPSLPPRRRSRFRFPAASILTDRASDAQRGSGPGPPARHTVRVEDMLRELSRVVLVDRTLTEVLDRRHADRRAGHPRRGGRRPSPCSATRRPFTAAHDGEMALAADELQYEHGYGPCMDAGRGGVLLRVDDMRTEERWPDYVAHVVRTTPVRSSLSVPLPYQGASIGALNNYSTQPAGVRLPRVAAGRAWRWPRSSRSPSPTPTRTTSSASRPATCGWPWSRGR